jgi:hypothetical protein
MSANAFALLDGGDDTDLALLAAKAKAAKTAKAAAPAAKTAPAGEREMTGAIGRSYRLFCPSGRREGVWASGTAATDPPSRSARLFPSMRTPFEAETGISSPLSCLARPKVLAGGHGDRSTRRRTSAPHLSTRTAPVGSTSA